MKRLLCFTTFVVLLAACSDEQPGNPIAPEGARFTQVETGPVVNSLLDPGVGTCDDIECTLREAIAFAAPGAIITFTVTGTILLAAQLEVGKNLTIDGPGAASLAVSGNHQVRVFLVAAGAAVRISRLKIMDGMADVGGGVRSSSENLVLSEVIVAGNHAFSRSSIAHGGGIWNGGTLRLENSEVTGNGAASEDYRGAGGGIFSYGTLAVTNSTITDNLVYGRPSGRGGGIFCYQCAGLIRNSTVSANRIPYSGEGSGIAGWVAGLALTNSTVAQNTANGNSAGIYLYGSGGSLALTNTLVAGNVALDNPDLDIEGTVTASHSLVGSTDGHPVTNGIDGNIVGVPWAEVGLAALADNGGPTRTQALLPGSPAIDAGTLTGCMVVDQRFVPRPQGAGCDIGAFEARAAAFAGFLQPLANPPLLNEVKAGQAVPVKFSLDGDQGPSVLASGYPVSVQFECDLSAGTSIVEETVVAGASGLSYDALSDTYTYVWKTSRSWANSCRRLTLQFADEAGTTRTAEFRFTR